MSAVTAVWVRKYEELVKERARLEQSLTVSQQMNEKTLETVDDYHRKFNDSQSAVQFLAGEVDRLSRELTSTNDSRHLNELSAAEWKSKYETAQIELGELEQELSSTRAEADEAERTLDLVHRDVTQLTQDKMSSYAVVEALRTEVAALKNVVNQQKLENTELESILLHQRYSEHPGNVAALSEHIADNSETDVTEKITFHNEDKTSPNSSVDPGADLSMEFVRLQKLLGRVATELDEDSKLQTGGSGAAEDKLNVGSDAVFATMLSYVMKSGRQSAELDLPSQMTSYSGILRHVTDCIKVLDNFTLNRELAGTLMMPWHKVEQRGMSLTDGKVSRQVVEAFRSCRQSFAGTPNVKGDTGADMASFMDDIFRQYMNRTLETVSQLSHTVQTTLDRVKTLPEELFAENKTAKKIGRKLTEAVRKLNSKVRSGLKHVASKDIGHKLTEAVNTLNSKVQSGWKHVASKFEDVRQKWFGYSESKCKHKKREEMKKCTRKNAGGDDRPPVEPFSESDEKVADKKSSYKKTNSAPMQREAGEYGPQKYLEDFLHSIQLDDFFEDNHRAWRQHNNRRLRKIGGRIERLNEEMFLSMDDDDVEDMYEDLEDVGEDLEKRDVTDDLRTWMSCQLRWWKTRIHRKHRTEDMVKGCGRQLMHWQLRVLCKQQKPHDKLSMTLPYRRLCDAVMTPTKLTHRGKRSQSYEDFLSAAPDTGSFEETEDWAVRNDSCLGGDWYFRRVQDREDRRQLSPQWYFDRVDDRQYSRGEANWYIRAMRHNAAASPVADDADIKGHTGRK